MIMRAVISTLRSLSCLAILGALCGLPTGCATTEPENTGRVRPVAELPPAYGELWVAWREEAPDWTALRRAALEDPALTRFLVENLVLDMLAGYGRADFATPGAVLGSQFDRARAELIVIGEPSTWSLAELNAIGNGYGSAIGGQALIEIGRPSIPAVVEQLDRKEFQARGRAVDVLAELPHARRGEPALQERLRVMVVQDPEWTVRKRCVDALAARASRDTTVEAARRSISRALGDPDEAVRRTAARALIRVGDPQGIPALINFLERCEREADLRGHDAALQALRALSGRTEPSDSASWRAYWRQRNRANSGR
jgi:hypothetical protein